MAPATNHARRVVIEAGSAEKPGASPAEGGVNFCVYSSTAEAVELCLFENGVESYRLPLPGKSGDYWHGWVPGCQPGQAYGYRVHGRYAPEAGLRSNPNKLLLDPYARALEGSFTWAPAIFDYVYPQSAEFVPSAEDSAPFVPKCIVSNTRELRPVARPKIAWRDMIVYEANVRGYTMRHPGLPESERGLFRGMRNGAILDYLSSLGITSLELMPVFEFIDEQHLVGRCLKNVWGYNSVNFFTPARRYLGGDDSQAFREMVDAIHDAGIEVILDVAYNHTGEGDRYGPTFCFRGLDNPGYYRLDESAPGTCVDHTGCGNTVNADHPVVQAMVLDSLRYWSTEMGVDGFRFDLATVLGRSVDGFRPDHPLLDAVTSDPAVSELKLIAEPWDVGPEGYQLGSFPNRWGEWNDRFRDDVRRFWRGDPDTASDLARRLHGSADIFEREGRGPESSINFITSHDGYTLADLVSYRSRHNQANGENNNDGHRHNYSDNFGVEGETDDPGVLRRRRQRRLNLLATLMYSQGTPMLLAGDEFGNSQSGNNNAYAQDNATGWTDWSGLSADPAFTDAVRDLIRARKTSRLLGQIEYRHGATTAIGGRPDIAWYLPDGRTLHGEEWHRVVSFAMVLSARDDDADHTGIAVLVNAGPDALRFDLPALPGSAWQLPLPGFDSPASPGTNGAWRLAGDSIACLVLRATRTASRGPE